MSTSTTIVLPDDASGRLDAFLSQLLPQLSRRRLKKLFREGEIRLDGRRVKGSVATRPGATVEIAGVLHPIPEHDVALDVVHEDDALVVVNKAPGVPAFPRAPDERGTLSGAMLARHPEILEVGDLPLAPGLCHRLDTGTSGLILFARTADAFAAVRTQFEARVVDKVYLARVAGRLEGEGTLDLVLGRTASRSATMVVAADGAQLRKSWPAVTHWRSLAPEDDSSLVEVRIETGVTHQIRVHLAHLGHPIVGDPRYGGPTADRMMLHASRLGLRHPSTHEQIEWRSDATFP